MAQCQKRTYGDALDEKALHPYMWAVKTHYYSANLAFYNYPYAFGQLFALSLYARAKEEGASFAATYRDILLGTGRNSVVDVTESAGFDIEGSNFYKNAFSVIQARIDSF
jgi:oligoendopeptidase F